MTFDRITEGDAVYLDANILIYFFNRSSQDCINLIRQCGAGRFYGLTSTATLAEVAHRTMAEEARRVTSRANAGVAYLRENPELVRSLHLYSDYVEGLVQHSGLGIIDVTQTDILGSFGIRRRYGLLTNDSIVLQILYDYGIPAIATNDSDFDSIPDILVYKPSDI